MSLLSPVALTNAQEAVEELFFFCGTASACGLDDAIEKHRLLILEELLQKKKLQNCRKTQSRLGHRRGGRHRRRGGWVAWLCSVFRNDKRQKRQKAAQGFLF